MQLCPSVSKVLGGSLTSLSHLLHLSSWVEHVWLCFFMASLCWQL